jgi:hypothetical protein
MTFDMVETVRGNVNKRFVTLQDLSTIYIRSTLAPQVYSVFIDGTKFDFETRSSVG